MDHHQGSISTTRHLICKHITLNRHRRRRHNININININSISMVITTTRGDMGIQTPRHTPCLNPPSTQQHQPPETTWRIPIVANVSKGPRPGDIIYMGLCIRKGMYHPMVHLYIT
jgi:hypothetical protein